MSRILSGIGLLIAAAILRMALHRLQDRAEDLRHSHISFRNGALARERTAAAPKPISRPAAANAPMRSAVWIAPSQGTPCHVCGQPIAAGDI
jgi:hypothetical protein